MTSAGTPDAAQHGGRPRWPARSRRRPMIERGDRPTLTRAHVLLVVGPGRDRSDRDRPRRGRLPLHARGPADPRLQQPADVGQHRPRRSPRHRRDHGPGDEAPVRPAGLRHRAPGAPRGQARRDPAGRPRQGLLHPRRRRGDRERDQARPRLHGPAQDPRPLPRLPRGDARGDDPDRRSRAAGPTSRPSSGVVRYPDTHRWGEAESRSAAEALQRPRGRHPLRGRPHDRRDLPRDDRRARTGS